MSRQTTTRRRHGVRRMSERKRLTITAITAVLALVTVVICALSGVFNFHKGNARILPNLVGQTEESAKAQLAELKKKETEAVVDKAIADGKISQEQKAVFMSLMASDRAHTEELLKSMTATRKRAADVFQDKSGDLTGKSWDELDKAGKLGELKAKNMAAFKDLYKQKFGVDYQE